MYIQLKQSILKYLRNKYRCNILYIYIYNGAYKILKIVLVFKAIVDINILFLKQIIDKIYK